MCCTSSTRVDSICDGDVAPRRPSTLLSFEDDEDAVDGY